jgi:hypothetical protein
MSDRQHSSLDQGVLTSASRHVRHLFPDVPLKVRLIAEWPAPPTEIDLAAVGLPFAGAGGSARQVENVVGEGGPRV